MRTLLLIVGGLLVVVLAALFAVPHVVDWGAYRGTLEAEATKVLGRPVRVGGNVELQLLPAPRLHLENVRIADSTGRFDRPLFRVQRFTLWLAVPPLLSGILEASSITLEEPELNLAVAADGTGNWAGLGTGLSELPYLPKEVTLNAVDVKGGRLSLSTADHDELLRIEKVDGELSAPALAGPYRFKGQAAYAGQLREVRLSSGVAGAEGLRVKAVATSPADGGSVTLDGTIGGIEGKLTINGSLDARLHSGLTGGSAGDADPQSFIELKSLLDADLHGGRLSDLTATFQSDGRPQIMTGSSEARWGKALSVDIALAAHWLDLDRIAGAGAEAVAAGPWPQIERLAGRLTRTVGGEGRMHVRLRLDQASLGGETVSGIDLDAEQTSSGVVIKSLGAGLPGASTIKASGLLKDGGIEGPWFQGPVQVRGQSLTRLIRWALPNAAGVTLDEAETQRGAFMIEGDVQLDRHVLVTERARLQIAGTSISGGLSIGFARDGAVAAELESDELDISEVARLPGSLASVLDMLDAGGKEGGEGGSGALLGLLTDNSRIDVRFGRLVTADGVLQDVVARLKRTGNAVTIDRLELRTGEGLAVQLDGAISLDAGHSGQLGLLVKAETGAAAEALGRFLGLSEAIAADARFRNSAGGLRLAGLLTVGRRAPGVLDISADGEVDGGRLSLSLRSDGSGKGLGSSRIEVFARLTSDDGGRIVDNLVRQEPRPAGAEAAPSVAGEGSEPGEISIRASGIPEKGLSTVVSLRSTPLAASFEGVATIAEGALALEGAVRATAADAGTALAALRLGRLVDAEGEALRLAAVLRRDASRLQLEDAIVAVGERVLRGGATFEDEDGRRVASISARASRLEMSSLLAGLVAGEAAVSVADVEETGSIKPDGEGDADVAGAAAEVPWSDRPFDFSVLKGVEARLELDADRLEVLPGLWIAGAGLVAEAGEGRVALSSLEGTALGGKVRIEGTLKQEAAGASASVSAQLTGVALEQISDVEAGLSRLRGRGNLTLAVAGKGLTPRGLVTVLGGSGEVRLGPGEAVGLAPLTADAVAQAVLGEKARKFDEEEIVELVAEKRFLGSMSFEELTAPVEVADGTLRIGDVVTEVPEARYRIRTALDLQTLALDSEWAFEPKPADGDSPPLPGLSLVYAGPMADAPLLAPRISADALVRELIARRLIGGPEQLQGVRPVDDLATPDTGFASPQASASGLATAGSETLDIPEPAVIAIPEPTAPQAISRAAPSVASGGGIVIRKLQKSGGAQPVRQAKQVKKASGSSGMVDGRR